MSATSSPAAVSSSLAARSARPRSRSWENDALWTMARSKSPSLARIASSATTLAPPADSPKMVTLEASPPSRWACSCTQVSAASWSARPRLPLPA